MKTKQNVETKQLPLDKIETKTKPKSLRPMRSMVALRSFKPKTTVATMAKVEEVVARD